MFNHPEVISDFLPQESGFSHLAVTEELANSDLSGKRQLK